MGINVYDTYGRLSTKSDQKGQAVVYTYDWATGRLKKIEKYPPSSPTPDPCQQVDLYWDSSPGTYSATATYRRLAAVRYRGKNCSAVNGNSYLEEYAYTNYGAVTGKQLTVTKKLANGTDASTAIAATWSYDGEGRPLTVGYPMSGPTYQYTWDARGMPSKLQRVSGADVVASVVYGPAGEMTSMTMGPGGGSEGRTYNINGQLTTLTLPGRTITYTFPTANNGKVASVTDSGETVNYGYDALNRLTSASVTSGWSQSFVYDGFGNLTGKTGTGGAPSWTPVNGVNPANNRLLGLSYDANGNQETIPMTAGMPDAFTASYDIDNRLTQMVNAAQTRRSEYDYDASNKRVWERRTGPDAGEWVYFFGADGSRMGRYAVTVGASSISLSQNQASVWFGGKLVQKVGSNWASPTWPNEDRLASVGRYLPYGEDKPGASNPVNDNEKFATYTRDAGTGIDYADQRWYGQGTGRFLTADPFQGSAKPNDPATWGRYGYVGADPVGSNDPSGLLTLVIHGSFTNALANNGLGPDYMRPNSDFMLQLARDFGETPIPYFWSGGGVTVATLYNGILSEGAALASYLNSIFLPPGEQLNIVAHSHGGSLVFVASYNLNRPIDNLVTLGTPENFDLPPIRTNRVNNFCAVSSTSDFVQVFAAGLAQVYGFAEGSALGTFYAGASLDALSIDRDPDEARRLFAISMAYTAQAIFWMTTTRLLFGANNVWITGESHSGLHTVAAWNRIAGRCGLRN